MSALARCFLLLSLLTACSHPVDSAISAPPPKVNAVASASPSLVVPADVTLPLTRSNAAPSGNALVVIASRARIALGADGPTIAVPDPATWRNGLDAKYKDGKPRGLRVRPLADAVAAHEAEMALGAIIVADASVSYAVFVELLFTLGMGGIRDIAIASRAADGAVVVVPIFLPQRGSDGMPAEKWAMEIAVRMSADGYLVLANGKPLDPGCREASAARDVGASDAGASITIARIRGALDDASLAACAATLAAPAPSDTVVTLFPQRAADMQTVVRAIDALGGDDPTAFRPVGLGLGRE